MFGIQKEDNLAKKSIKLVIFFALVLTPLIFSTKHTYFFATPKYVFMSFVGSICLFLLILYLLENKFSVDKKVKIFLCLGTALVLWLCASSLLGVNPETSFWSNFGRHTGFFSYFFGLVLLFASLLVFNKRTLPSLFHAFTLGGVLSVISIYLSPAFFDVNLTFLKNSANGGTFGNTTYAAIFLVFSLFSALILFFVEKSKTKKIIWAICAVLLLVNPIFINIKGIFAGNVNSFYSLLGEARAGSLSILIGLFLSLVFYFCFSKKKVYSILANTLLVLVFTFGVYILINVFNPESRLHQTFAKQVEGVRFVYWDMAEIGIAERPILGFGLENFAVIHNKYFDSVLLSPEYPPEPWANKPHNAILEIAFSAGIIGLGLYLSLIGFALISLARKASESDRGDRITASMLFGIFVSYIFQIFFAFDTISSIQAFFVTLAVNALFSLKEIDNLGKRQMDKYLKGALIFVAAVLSLLMIYFLSLRVGMESKMMRQLNSISIPKRISQFTETMNKSPVGTLTTESQYIDILIEKYKRDWKTFSEDVKKAALKEVKFLLDYSIARSDKYPDDFRFALVSAKAANLLYLISDEDKANFIEIAKKYGIRAIGNSPSNEKGYRVIAETFFNEGKIDTAIRFADMMIGLNERVSEFHDLAIFFAKIEKNEKLVAEKTEYAKKFIPNYEYSVKK